MFLIGIGLHLIRTVCLTAWAMSLLGSSVKLVCTSECPFSVIFRARSRERSQRHFSPGRFLSRRCFTLCITMKVEPRIAQQYKCHHCCSCKNYRGKGMESGKKCICTVFWLTRRSRVREKNAFGASYSTSNINKLFFVARHILTTGLQKIWQCKIRKITVTAFRCEKNTHRK